MNFHELWGRWNLHQLWLGGGAHKQTHDYIILDTDRKGVEIPSGWICVKGPLGISMWKYVVGLSN